MPELVGSMGEDGRRDLPIGDPVSGDGRAGTQQLLRDHKPFDVGPPLPTELRGDGHAEPAAFG